MNIKVAVFTVSEKSINTVKSGWSLVYTKVTVKLGWSIVYTKVSQIIFLTLRMVPLTYLFMTLTRRCEGLA